jgi:UDP-3-O-[3-hydroxymyristoyl] glucosamine N-acyltransferase
MAERPSYTTAQLADLVGGTLNGPGELLITGINSMAEATEEQVTFIASPRYAGEWNRTRAGAALITRGLAAKDHDPSRRALIEVDNAELATAAVLEAFAPRQILPDVGIHPTAFVHPQATVAATARIGPLVCIDRGAVIGEQAVLMPGVRIYAEASIGDQTVIHANAVIRERCRVGKRVTLHQNTSIGADGFGYRPAPDGAGLVKMLHIGTVIIEDDVEIGSGSCIDRAKFGATTVGRGTKIDNLVQVAHNCQIGQCCVIAGQTGIAGSVTIGNGVQIGAQAGIADGLTIGDGARIGAQAGVMRDVPAGMQVLGTPADEAKEALRQMASIRKLPDLIRDEKRRRRAETRTETDDSLL